MLRRPPRSTRTDTLLPYTTLFRSEDHEDRHQQRIIFLGGADFLRHFGPHHRERGAIDIVDDGGERDQRDHAPAEAAFDIAHFFAPVLARSRRPPGPVHVMVGPPLVRLCFASAATRSDERREGKECGSTGRYRWWPC